MKYIIGSAGLSIIRIPNAWGWQLRRDGTMWRAIGPSFVNRTESPCGYGSTPGEAVEELSKIRSAVPSIEMVLILLDVSWMEVEGGLLVEEP